MMRKSKARVFLLEPTQSNIDVSSAAEFGELTYLFKQGDARCSVFDTERYTARLKSRLQAACFDQHEDVICIAGKIACVAALCACVAGEYGAFSILLFDAHDEVYVKRTLT
jgi:hypothetical protein